MHQQQPPGCPETTERHRAQGQTGRREHDSDVLQRALQGKIQQERVHLTFSCELVHVRLQKTVVLCVKDNISFMQAAGSYFCSFGHHLCGNNNVVLT